MNKIFITCLLLFSCSLQNASVDISNTKLNQEIFYTDLINLSLKEKIAQMIMVRVRGDYYSADNSYRKLLKKWISEYGVGGLITFGGSIHGTFYNIKEYQSWARIPLLVGADYERGVGQWMKGSTLFPSNMAIAATNNKEFAYRQGEVTAKEANALGVHITFAPVLDINNNSKNPIINFRSYSDNPETVTKFGIEFIKGIQEHGIVACAKHYPGHGNTDIDSHSSLPTIRGSKSKLDSLELYPFMHAVKAGVKMIMVGHIALPDIDKKLKPASHSFTISTEILRNEWGFNGVLITDGMEMGGLTQATWSGEAAVRAVEAGTDILLLPMDIDKTINSIYNAVKNGRIKESRIDESIKRIWKMKTESHSLSNNKIDSFLDLQDIIGDNKHMKLAREIAQRSITVVKDKKSLLPLKVEKIDSLAHIILSLDDNARDYLKIFSNDLKRTHEHTNELFVNNKLSELGIKDIIQRLDGVKQIIISLLVRIRMDKGIATIDSTHNILLSEIKKLGVPTVVISFGSPYLNSYEMIDTYMCTYGYGSVTMEAAANSLWGRQAISGILPVTLNDKYQIGFGMQINKRIYGWGENKTKFPKAWSIIDSAINNKIFPGAQVFISKDNNILYSGGFGRHTYEKQSEKVTNKTIYDIASITKVLSTTPIIMKMVAKKQISLDQPVRFFIPEFKGGNKDLVTIRHLLTHSSGIKAYRKFFLEKNIKTQKDIINEIISMELEFMPGTKFSYSDLGFILLKEIIELLTNKPIEQIADSWIFSPLDMNSTYYLPNESVITQIAPTEIDNIYRNRLVHGEVHDENTYLMGGVSTHAGVFSKSEDIANYAQMYLNRGSWRGNRIFKESIIKKFTKKQNTPKSSDYAIGWDTPSNNGKSSAGDFFSDGSFGHLGFTGTSLWIDPNQNIIIVLLTNRVYPSREREGIYGIRRKFYNAVMDQLL